MATNQGEKILRTRLCDMLGIKYPIIQAGMGTVSGPTLAAAVSNAGGLGVIAAIDLLPEELRRWIKKTRSLTDKPFAVDTIFVKSLPPKLSMDDVRRQMPKESSSFADKMREETGIPRSEGRADTMIASRQTIEEQLQVCIDEKVPILVSALGNPEWILPQARAHGMKVMGLVGNVKEARQVAATGVDIIIAQGHEGGGHTGRIGTLALIPQVVDAVHPVPMVAAGGIADGRGLVASLALGAVGVWCGTAFAVSYEACTDHVEDGIYTQWEVDLRKQKIIDATEDDPRITRVITGKTLRNLSNKLVRKWEEEKGPILKQWPFQCVLIGDLQEGVRQKQMGEYHAWAPAGQIAGLVKELKSSRQIVDDMVAEAVELLSRGLHQDVDIGPASQA